jgi:hypothetical protein
LNSSTTAASGPEGIAEAEELTENIAQILERRSVETSRSAARAAGDSCVTESVIERALFRIGQNRVGLRDFFEAFFGIRIIRVAIGMPLHGELAVGALQFLIGDCAGYREDFVIIAFCVCGQDKNLSLSKRLPG